MIDCEHQWNWDKETRFCLKCGQVRTFPKDNKAPRVVWQGFDDKRNPIELSVDEKVILVHFAKELGIKKASDCIKIPMKLLRAWCGAYCRKPKVKVNKPTESGEEIKSTKRPYHRRMKVELLQKSPLSIKVAKSDLLPPFPAFDSNWQPEVQMEWISTFLELIKLRAVAKV